MPSLYKPYINKQSSTRRYIPKGATASLTICDVRPPLERRWTNSLFDIQAADLVVQVSIFQIGVDWNEKKET
jgi:hypothetical protein